MSLLTLTLTACAANEGMKPHPPTIPRRHLELGLVLGIEAAFTDVRNDYDCIENHRPDCPAADDEAMLGRASLGLATSAPQTAPWLRLGLGVADGLDVDVGATLHAAELGAHWRFHELRGGALGFEVAPALRYSWWVSMITPLDDVLAIQHYGLWTATLPVDLKWQVPRGPLLWGGPLAQVTHYDLRATIDAMPLDAALGPPSGWTHRLGGHFGSAWNWNPVEVRTDVTIAALGTPEATYDGYVALVELGVFWVH